VFLIKNGGGGGGKHRKIPFRFPPPAADPLNAVYVTICVARACI